MRGAVGERERAFLVAAGGADQAVAQRPGPLAGDQADAAGRGVPQDMVARLQALGRQRALEQVLRGQALEHHGGAGLEADRVGQAADRHRRHDAPLAVAARLGAGGVGDAIADLQVRDARADRLDHAGALAAEDERHAHRIQARALVGVDEVGADRVMADADLARAGLADLEIDELQLFGAAGLGDADGAAVVGGHGDLLLWVLLLAAILP